MAAAKIDGHEAAAMATRPRPAKVDENRLRRAAKRQGLRLTRSRRRDPLAYDYGLYTLSGPGGPLLQTEDLAEIERALTDPYAVKAHWQSHHDALGRTLPPSVIQATATAPRERIMCEHRFTNGNFEVWECSPGEPWTMTKRGWREQGCSPLSEA
jgi:hypothetical protein